MKAKENIKRLIGQVKLINIKEQDLKEGMKVIIFNNSYSYKIVTINNLQSVRLTAIEIKYETEGIGIQNRENLKTLVVEYKEYDPNRDNGAFKLIQLPIKQSQWKYAISEIGKEVEFVIQYKNIYEGTILPLHKEVAKIIPNKIDKSQERYERAGKFLIVRDNTSKNIEIALKIAAGIEE